MSNEPTVSFTDKGDTGLYALSNVGSTGRTVTIVQNFVPSLGLSVGGETLLTINRDGTVEAPSIEAASEAGRVFIDYIRNAVGAMLAKPEGSRYAKLTVAELEAEQAAIECALEAARKAEAA